MMAADVWVQVIKGKYEVEDEVNLTAAKLNRLFGRSPTVKPNYPNTLGIYKAFYFPKERKGKITAYYVTHPGHLPQKPSAK